MACRAVVSGLVAAAGGAGGREREMLRYGGVWVGGEEGSSVGCLVVCVCVLFKVCVCV